MSRIGILGGSFDPVHLGHLSIGNTAREEFNLDKILLLPAKVSPFKIGHKMASTDDRLNMIKLVSQEYNNFIVSTYEINCDEISYTFNTLSRLKEIYKDDDLFFIMGTDSLMGIETWYRGSELLRNFSYIIGARPGFNEALVTQKVKYYRETYNADLYLMHNKTLNISSTDIKNNIKNGKSIKDLIPSCIEEYINDNGLYK